MNRVESLIQNGQARYPSLDISYYDLGQGLISFRAVEPFEVDGVEYNWSWSTTVSRLIVQDVTFEHDCGERCGFDWGSDVTDRERQEVVRIFGEAYRWKRGMVYYRVTEFDTPPYGEHHGRAQARHER